jgi:hypothetical protein
MATHEVLNHSFEMKSTATTLDHLRADIRPDLPWADDHFEERVSGEPLNPPPSEAWWPHAPKGNNRFKSEDGTFSHTYPERYWPQYAGESLPKEVLDFAKMSGRVGIRFRYGDLDDLTNCLAEDPLTRQAYLPVWFPEDLGAPMSERKPCTLGYHFIMRDNRLHVIYYIRSCDFLRHFRNDIYMTVRLQHWVLEQCRMKNSDWQKVKAGSFTMHITSLHLFRNDYIQVFGNG